MNPRVYDKYIFQIQQQGSLTKAAAALGISQPALSSGLTALEKELGFQIFHRRKTPITFTPEGQLYFDYISRIRVLTEDFQTRLHSQQDGFHRQAAIGGPVAYMESMVADAVMEVGRGHPEYQLRMKCSPLPELKEMAARGKIHCFICTSEALPENFAMELIEHERVYLCIPRDNPVNELMKPFRVSPGETGPLPDYRQLQGQEFLFLEEGQPLQSQMMAFFRDFGITPMSHVTVNQVSTAVNLAIRGRGICFASEESLRDNRDLSRVCIYPLPESISGRKIYVAYDKELHLPQACRDLIRCLIRRNEQEETL